MANNNPTHMITGKARISYEHLTKPYAQQPGAEEKFSATLIIPKSDIATKQRIDAALAAATQEGITGKWNGVRPAQVSTPIYDGDGVRPNGEPFGPECKGAWVMTASSKLRPEVVDLNLQPILSASEIYSGMYARVSINFFAYFNSGKKGIGCGLNNVQKIEDGEPLGGRTTAAADFGSGPDYTAAPAYQQPQPAYAPQQTYAPQYPAQPAYAPPQPSYIQQPTAYPTYPQPLAPVIPQQLDPITGKPLAGGIMGL